MGSRVFAILMFTFGVVSQLQALSVNLKNGILSSNTFVFISVPGGQQIPMEVNATYATLTGKKGIFGHGWGSNLETRLKIQEGGICIEENLIGDPNCFVSVQGKANTYESFREGPQSLKLENNQYVRILPTEEKQIFSKEGKLLARIDQKSSYRQDYSYSGEYLTKISDNQGRQLFFEYYPTGLIKEAKSSNGQVAKFTYNAENLITAQTVGNEVYTYAYDGNNNMTKLSYEDGTSYIVGYDPKTQFVSQFTDRFNVTMNYEYGENPQNPKNDYWTIVTTGKISSKYGYVVKQNNKGEEYTYQTEILEGAQKKGKELVGGNKVVTTYNECCGLPLKIDSNGIVTEFKYNDQGMILERTSTDGTYAKLQYDSSGKKPIMIEKNDGIRRQTFNYEYDKKGNLVKAKDADNTIVLGYDSRGNIVEMVRSDAQGGKHQLKIEYNAQSKPVEMTGISGGRNLGTMNVSYDNFGEIANLQSKDSRGIASTGESTTTEIPSFVAEEMNILNALVAESTNDPAMP